MKVLFVYSIQKSVLQEKPLLGQEGIYLGISFISGLLKQQGHSCELVVLDRRYKKKNLSLLNREIKAFSPDILAFTAVYSEFEFIYNLASEIRTLYPDLFLLAGGVHLTLNPDERYLDVFNAFCIGEGEEATLELVENLAQGKDISQIANLWVRTPDGITKNPCRPFIANLDSLPFADRDMWQRWILKPETKPAILVGRGCPFNCTYCCNHKLRKVTTGQYVRLRSAENILAEIRQLHCRFPRLAEIYLEVETLGVDLQWLEVFCDLLHRFGQETGFQIRFATNLRIFPRLDIETVFRNFKKANILSVTIGLESGSYRLRKEILNRDYSNELILSAAVMAKEMGIDISLFNMVGLPTETREEFQETLKINQLVQPHFHATSIFFPYQGTAIYDICKELGVLPERVNTNDERQRSVLDLPGFSSREIERSFNSFHYNVYKVRPDASRLKLAIYFLMRYAGHNRFANLKISLIRIMYRLRIMNFAGKNFLSIFQKSK
ncbi:B12-binding domain-containing radical SAM protein [Bacteroidales bacterium OttesenSCG-928-L03]|nr:B12-binding domain-containing radical SAM protein [Bacteroidales bacterium OttesenSCG-928-L03]